MDLATQFQILDKAVCFSHSANPFRKCMNPTILPLATKCPGYDIKPSDGEAPALEIWRMLSTSSLTLLPGPF